MVDLQTVLGDGFPVDCGGLVSFAVTDLLFDLAQS